MHCNIVALYLLYRLYNKQAPRAVNTFIAMHALAWHRQADSWMTCMAWRCCQVLN